LISYKITVLIPCTKMWTPIIETNLVVLQLE